MKRLALVSILVLLAACAHTKGPMAVAMLTPISGSHAHGTVHFQELSDGSVDVTADLTSVPPGVHGLHVHEKGDCSGNGMAAGDDFNPMNMPHGSPQDESHHAGDLGNVTAGEKGEIHVDVPLNTFSITVHSSTTSVLGRAVVLHANPDDLVTQPDGNSGARIACGIVQEMAGPMHK